MGGGPAAGMQALIPAATRHCCSAPLAAPSLLPYTCVSSRHQVAELADAAHGFVPADLGALCNEAALAALRRRIGAGGGGSAGAAAAVAGPAAGQGQAGLALCVTPADFAAAETRVRPSAMREVALEVPKVGAPGGLEPGSFLHGRFRPPSSFGMCPAPAHAWLRLGPHSLVVARPTQRSCAGTPALSKHLLGPEAWA